MSKEIKFRFRYSDGKRTIDQVFTLEECLNGVPFEVLSDQPLLRNFKHVGQDRDTGLTDGLGKRIIEGDIIKMNNGTWGVIVWKAPFFEVTVSKEQSSLYTREFIEDSVVIGNIYANPELTQ